MSAYGMTKSIAYTLAGFAGVPRLLQRIFVRDGISILMYHSVTKEPLSVPDWCFVQERSFQEQMVYLKNHCRVIPLKDVPSLTRENNGRPKVAITFDDGYRDNFLCAFPVLKAFDLPATIFLATGYLDSCELPWYDQISWAFKLTTQPRLSLGHLGGPEAYLGGRSERLQAMSKTLAWLRVIKQDDRLRHIPQVLDALHVPAHLSVPNPMLSWEEVRQMYKQNICFGAHTVSHPVLAKIQGDKLEEEITGSKNKIEEKLQRPVQHFDMAPQTTDRSVHPIHPFRIAL